MLLNLQESIEWNDLWDKYEKAVDKQNDVLQEYYGNKIISLKQKLENNEIKKLKERVI